MTIDLAPLGDRAWLARFATERQAVAWASALRSQWFEGVVDIVPAYRSVGVFLDPDRAEPAAMAERLRGLEVPESAPPVGRRFLIPVLYNGPDLDDVADRLAMTVDQVIAAHDGQEYEVFAVGFQPGFPYAGYLPDALRGLPRLKTPRRRVPAGSVAIAGRQTGIYPRPSPGGWRLIGATPLVVSDPDEGFFPIRPGDRIVFRPVDAREFDDLRGERLGPDQWGLDPDRPA